MEPPDTYRAYLLRAWRDVDPHSGRVGPWRFSLEQPGGQARRGFRSLAELAAYFQMTFHAVAPDDGFSAPQDTRILE